MLTKISSPSIFHPGAGGTAPAILAVGPGRRLVLSGQCGFLPDGTLAPTASGQIEQTWRNLIGLLQAGGMKVGDLVKITTFLTDPEHVTASREIRSTMLQGHEPASTLLIVKGLFRPDCIVEIEAEAQKA